MRNGCVDLHRLECFVAPLLLGPGITGAHIVQSVAQLDNHDPDVLTHGQEHFAQVLRLTILDVGKFDLGQLGHAVHQKCHFRAEFLPDFLNRHSGIFRHIVHKGGRDALTVHAQFHKNLRHADRVADIRLTAAAELPRMGGIGQRVGLVNHVKIVGASAGDQVVLERFIAGRRLLCLFRHFHHPQIHSKFRLIPVDHRPVRRVFSKLAHWQGPSFH